MEWERRWWSCNLQEYKRLFSNFSFLFFNQVVGYLFPLITFPYLVRVLGIEKFGLLAFATATIAYFRIFIDFGFNLAATKEVSVHRNDKEVLSEIFSSVLILKFIFLILSFLLLTILVVFVDRFQEHYIIYYLTFGIVIGEVLFPQWFFQGIENMKYITYLNFIAKLIFTIAIFVFVHRSEDIWKVPLLNALGFIVVGIFALRIVLKNFGISFKFQKWETLKYYFHEGWYIFISQVAISLYTTSTIFILGIFANNTIVGYYAAADKIRMAFQNLLTPISQTIYPHIAKVMKRSKSEAVQFIRKTALLMGSIAAVISMLLFFFADFWIGLFLGQEYESSIVVLKILSFLPFIIGLSNIFGIQTMLIFGMKKSFSKVLIWGSLLNLLLSFILVPLFYEIGSALSVVCVESFITFTMFFLLKKSGIDLLKGKIYV